MNDAAHSSSTRIGRIALCLVGAVAGAAVLLGSTCNLTSKAPTVPVLSGPSSGVVGVPVTFKATATDPEGDSIAFQFDWGDTTTPAWTVFVASGDTVTPTNTYSDSGTYTIKVKAKDKSGKESGWTEGLLASLVSAGPAYPDSLVGTIIVGYHACGGYVTPDGQYLFVMHDDEDSVTPVRLVDRTVLPKIAVGMTPTSMAATPDNRYLYVSCNADTLLPVIDIAQRTVVARVRAGRMPRGVVLSPDGVYAFVGLSQDQHIAVIRTSDNTVVDSIPLDNNAFNLAIDHTGRRIYVSMRRELVGIIAVEQRELVDSVECNALPGLLCVSPSGDRLYVASNADSGFATLNTSTVEFVLRTNLHVQNVEGLQATPDGFHVLVTSPYGYHCVASSNGTQVGALPYGGWCGLAMRPQGDSLYLFGRDTVYVVGQRAQRSR